MRVLRVKVWIRWLWRKDWVRFAVMGGGVAFVCAVILTVCVELFNYEKIIVNRYLLPVAFVMAFVLHREVTWANKKGALLRDFVLFFFSRFIVTVFNVICFEYLVTVPWIPYMLVNPALLFVESLINFGAGRLIYRKKNA